MRCCARVSRRRSASPSPRRSSRPAGLIKTMIIPWQHGSSSSFSTFPWVLLGIHVFMAAERRRGLSLKERETCGGRKRLCLVCVVLGCAASNQLRVPLSKEGRRGGKEKLICQKGPNRIIKGKKLAHTRMQGGRNPPRPEKGTAFPSRKYVRTCVVRVSSLHLSDSNRTSPALSALPHVSV